MTYPLVKSYSLAAADGDGLSPYLNEEGAFLGPGLPLLHKIQFEGEAPVWQVPQQAELEQLMSVGYGYAVSLDSRWQRWQALAHAMTKGDLSLASIILVRLALPPLPSIDHAQQLAKAAGAHMYVRLGTQPNPGWFWYASGSGSKAPPKQKTKIPPLPEGVRDYFNHNKQMGNWQKFNAALAKMPGLTDQERLIYAQIFAWEGGMMSHGTSGAFAGIKPDIFKAAKDDEDACKAIPGLDKVKKVSDLTPGQLAGVYRWYFDDIFQHVGGHQVLAEISDSKAAATLGDTLFNLGAPDGTKLLLQAVNDVRTAQGQEKIPTVSSSGKTITWVSQGLIKAYKELSSDDKTRALLIAKVRELRDYSKPYDGNRHAYFQ